MMIDLDFLRGLISALDESSIDSLEISRGGTRIRVSKTPPLAPAVVSAPATHHVSASGAAPAPAPPMAAPAAAASETSAAGAASASASNLVEVRSPMVGTFYRAPSPEAPPYVEVGTRVGKGQTLCILEAMKLMNELEAEISGVIREVCVENAEPVEYGQVLYRIEPDA
jgi:acetyl-CoA carboxylase biotin carboxyl carrier protein